MADNFEFDDNDDVLLNAICTPPNRNEALEKRLSEENSENLPVKRPKLGESDSPIIQFTQKNRSCSKESENLVKSNSSPNVNKRIFPGPAGILLDENQTDLCSQDTFSFFQDGPWQEMSKDFKISSSLHLYDKFNIAWIKKEAIAKKLVNQKAPFLASILLSLEVSEGHAQKIINVTLKDKTGTIQGTILQNLYEEHASHFTLGSVLVLLQFGILSCTCDKCDNHHLTITPKNLCAIYSGKEKLVIKQVDPENVLKEYIEKRKEFELDRLKKTYRLNVMNSPLHSGALSNRPVPAQSPCTSGLKPSQTFVSPLVRGLDISSSGKTPNEKAHDTYSPCASRTDSLKPSQTNVPPMVRSLVKNSSQKSINEGAQDTYSPGNAVKRLFSFKKVSNEAKVEENLTNTQELLRNFTEQVDAIATKECLETQQEESKTETEETEHEKIWKDVLEDVDVNSFFDEDF